MAEAADDDEVSSTLLRDGDDQASHSRARSTAYSVFITRAEEINNQLIDQSLK